MTFSFLIEPRNPWLLPQAGYLSFYKVLTEAYMTQFQALWQVKKLFF